MTFIDMSALVAEVAAKYPDAKMSSNNEPSPVPFTFTGDKLTFQLNGSEGVTGTMTGTVKWQGNDLVIDGTLTVSGTGPQVEAKWRLTEQ
jgi:hypothetical protein